MKVRQCGTRLKRQGGEERRGSMPVSKVHSLLVTSLGKQVPSGFE